MVFLWRCYDNWRIEFWLVFNFYIFLIGVIFVSFFFRLLYFVLRSLFCILILVNFEWNFLIIELDCFLIICFFFCIVFNLIFKVINLDFKIFCSCFFKVKFIFNLISLVGWVSLIWVFCCKVNVIKILLILWCSIFFLCNVLLVFLDIFGNIFLMVLLFIFLF